MSSRRDLIADVVAQIEEHGPNLSDIARRLDVPEGSVRSCFRTNIQRNGFTIISNYDWGAVGLRCVRIVADVSKLYARHAYGIFYAMDNHWFCLEFDRTLPDGKFIISFLLPEERFDQFPRLLERMKEIGFIDQVHETHRPTWKRHTPMRTELFDFRRVSWDFDWSKLSRLEPPEVSPRTPRQELDSKDVSILIYTGINACRPITEFARRENINTKAAYRHLAHVRERKLMEGYRLLWTKNQIDPATGQPRHPAHRYSPMVASVTGIGAEETAELREKMNALPFLWTEMGGQDNYSAFLVPPLERMTETMAYLRVALKPVRERSSCRVVDMSCATRFTLPRLYDDSARRWSFDVDDQMARLEGLLANARRELPVTP